MARSEFTFASVSAAVAASVGMFVGTTPMIAAVASLFIQPISRELKVSRTVFSLIMLVSPWIVAVSAPFGGRLLDRFGTRPVILPVVLIFGLIQWAIWRSTALWQVLLLYAIGGLCGAVHTYTSYTRVVSTWFSQRRGLVMGLVIALGSGLGGVLIPQLVRVWIGDYGWHRAYFGMGCIILFYGLPVLALLLREPVNASRAKAGSREAGAELPGVTWREALRGRTFWTIAFALVLAPLAIAGTIAHIFPLLTERGFSAYTAGLALSCLYAGGMVGQLTSGFSLDRVNSPRVALPFFALALVGVILVHITHSTGALIVGAVLLGMGSGSEIGIAAYLISRFFGLKNYGAIYGTVFGGANLGLGVGLLAMGQVHDRFGSYAPMAYVMPFSLAITIVLILSLGPYTFARRASPHGDTPRESPTAAVNG